MANSITIRIVVPDELINKPAYCKKLVATVLKSDEVLQEVLVDVRETQGLTMIDKIKRVLSKSPTPMTPVELGKKVHARRSYLVSLIRPLVEEGVVEKIKYGPERGNFTNIFYIWKTNESQMEIATRPGGLEELAKQQNHKAGRKPKKAAPAKHKSTAKKPEEGYAVCEDFTHITL